MAARRPQLRALAGPPPKRLNMRSPIAELPEATLFSAGADFSNPLTLISMVKGMAPMWRRLREKTRVVHESGPPRGPGEWALVFLAFTISGHVNIRTWFERSARYNVSLWQACGFDAVPDYAFVHERFAELEPFAEAFEAAGAELMQHARRCDPRVGAHWHVDGTEAATHAAPRHDCRRGDPCPTAHVSRHGRLRMMETSEATALREEAASQPADGSGPKGPSRRAKIDDVDREDSRGGVRFRSGGHWWYSRDASAGVRAYTSGGRVLKAWHGFYHQHVFDHFTKGILSTTVHAADETEWTAYPRVYEKAREAIGADPLAVAVDRGLTWPKIYEFHTRRGVATVGPYRRMGGSDPLQAVGTEKFDVHGVPLCQHCGKGGDFVRFVHRPRPRISFRCALPETDECLKVQSISCAENWRRLIPLWRTSEAYGALRHTHDNHEAGHQAMRERYRSGGKSKADRPRRIGLAWQQLRASAGLLVEWLWICRRQGWLGSSGRHAQAVLSAYGSFPANIARRRNRLGLVGGSVPGSVIRRPVGLPPPAPPPPPLAAPLPAAAGAALPF